MHYSIICDVLDRLWVSSPHLHCLMLQNNFMNINMNDSRQSSPWLAIYYYSVRFVPHSETQKRLIHHKTCKHIEDRKGTLTNSSIIHLLCINTKLLNCRNELTIFLEKWLLKKRLSRVRLIVAMPVDKSFLWSRPLISQLFSSTSSFLLKQQESSIQQANGETLLV